MTQELERFDPEQQAGRISYEHLHRYALCREYVEGKHILDVASGTGYGTYILSGQAASTTGLDADQSAVNEAGKRYIAPNLRFVAGDCISMPFDDNSFDVVISNETIEHIHGHDKFISEVKRVLRPNGLFIVSTPNKPVYNRYKAPNKFHVSEMDIPEFQQLLNRHFNHIFMMGLRMGLVSLSFKMDHSIKKLNLPSAQTYIADLKFGVAPEVNSSEIWLDQPEYILAVCSVEELKSEHPGPSLFFSRDDDLWLDHERIMAWASGLHEEDEVLRSDLRNALDKIQSIQGDLDKTRRDYENLNDHNVQLNRDAASTVTVSRLLSKMTGQSIDGDNQSVIEQLFLLNQNLVTQKGQLELAQKVAASLPAIEQQVGNLSLKLADAEKELSSVKAQLEYERNDAEKIRAHLNERSQVAEEAAAKLPVVERELESVRSKLLDTEEGFAAAKVQADYEQDQAAKIRTQLNESNQVAEETAVQLSMAQGEVADLHEQLESSLKDLTASNERLHQMDGDIADLKMQLTEARNNVAIQNNKAEISEKYANDYRRKLEELRSELTQASILLDREKNEKQEIRRELSDAGYKISRQRKQLEDAKALENRILTVENYAMKLRDELADTLGNLADAKELLDQEQRLSRTSNDKVEELNREIVKEREASVNAEREIIDLRQKILVSDNAVNSYRDEIGAVQSRIDLVVRDRDDLRAKLADTADILDRERADAEELKAQLGRQDHASAAVVALQAELDAARQEMDSLRSTRQQELVEIQTLKVQYDAMRSERDKSKSDAGTVAGRQPKLPTLKPNSGGVGAKPISYTQKELERFVKFHSAIQHQIHAVPDGLHAQLSYQPRLAPQESALKRWGKKLDRDAAPFRTILFDAHWLALQSPDAVNVRFGRYLRDSSLWTLDPHPLFSSAYYLSKNPDVAAEAICPLLHYLTHGWREGRNPHPYFINDWYLAQDPILAPALTVSPLEHYLLHGWREGRAPNPLFSPRAYLERYPDVAEADMEPLTHYLVYGRKEQRDISLPSVNSGWVTLLSAEDRKSGLMDFMLENAPMALPKNVAAPVIPVGSPNWPPERLNDFWIPQQLRDFIIEGGNEGEIDLYTYFCSVMEAFRDTPENFPQSKPCQQISDRIRTISAARAAVLPEQPDASIIIPVYNNIIDTLLCISSVMEDDTSKSYEIIVADDGSSDATPEIIGNLGGVVRYLRQPRNYGFLGNCNEAAKEVRGRYIVLLNNDTLVMPNWLDAMLDVFDRHEGVGLSGSKLISWDGTLQEAGGIYWKDGSAWNFGRGANARAAEFNYLKDVDYVSGAAIAIPTDIWRNMDGFDEIYAPAYCEDSDIAFRLREAGYRTIMNPASEVLHHEGRSHGRDLNSGIKAYQVKNQETFFERWREVLERDHFPNAQNVWRARDRSFFKKHVLVIDHYVPQWDQDAGSRSTFMCIKALLNLGYAVTFWPDNLWRNPQYTPQLQDMGVEVIFGADYRNGFAEFMRARQGLYDAVFANRPHIACNYMKNIREIDSNTKIIYYGHDLHFKRMMAAQLVGEDINDTDIAMMRSQELDVCSQADIILYPDQHEVDVVQQILGGNRTYRALPVYAFDKDKFDQSIKFIEKISINRSGNILFVGGFNHTPNLDGIVWFVESVLPIIQSRIDGVNLTIVGSNAPDAVLSFASDRINVAGFVSDERLLQLYEEASLVIAPLRYGGGVKGKVIEAMATGVPLVTTPIGAQGLEGPEDLMFLASEAESFADAVVLALTDRVKATRKATTAWKYVKKHYSMEALEKLFREFIG